MKILSQYLEGLRVFSGALGFIIKHRLWSVVALPVAVNVLVVIGFFFLFQEIGYSLYDYLINVLGSENSSAFLETVISLVVILVCVSVFLLMYQYVSLMILAPFLSIVADKVLNICYGKEKASSWVDFFPMLWRGVRVTIRIIWLQILVLTFTYVLLSVFVVTAPLIPVALFLVNAYFIGYAFYDYVSEYWQYSFKESVLIVKGQMGRLFAVGTVYQLLFFVPVVGWVFAPTLCLVMSCLLLYNKKNNNLTQF